MINIDRYNQKEQKLFGVPNKFSGPKGSLRLKSWNPLLSPVNLNLVIDQVGDCDFNSSDTVLNILGVYENIQGECVEGERKQNRNMSLEYFDI